MSEQLCKSFATYRLQQQFPAKDVAQAALIDRISFYTFPTKG